MTTIEAEDPTVESIPESERVVVGEKVTHRQAQRPASYEVLRYVLRAAVLPMRTACAQDLERRVWRTRQWAHSYVGRGI